ncbi:M23 family metallopeptidase [Streptosporangium sp. NPDC087985]|uniref:M23 family metallopeptidase n=1 Tax=Streptosporangium sp. NPDC087985 TaxID=3366196 RepID=UPI003828A520
MLNPPGHSRWAFDLLPLEPGSAAVAEGGWWRYLTCRLRSSDVSGWARPVRSPLDGEVLVGHDGEPDRDRLVPWRDVPAGLLLRPLLLGKQIPAMAGNHVVLGADGTYVLLAHLQQGSVRVASGQAVRARETIGLIGASGNALGPHLHLQVMNGPDPLTARPVPFAVRRYRLWDGRRWHGRNDSPLPAKRVRISVD